MVARSATVLCLSLLLAGGSFAELVLSEVVADNGATGFKAADGSAYDWIELHNTAATAVDLDGCYLTDLAGFSKWRFVRSFVIPAGGFRIVFASDRNGLFDGEEHTNFKLNSTTGEYLGLLDPDGVTVLSEFAPQFPALNQSISFGRVSNTDTLAILETATPNAANSGAAPVAEVTSFTASAAMIAAGANVTLAWTTANADSVELASSHSPPFFDTVAIVPANDSTILSPGLNTTYRVRAINAYGSQDAFVEVGVGPEILEFTATPTTIATGGSTILEWRVAGSDVSVSVNGTPAESQTQRLRFSPDLAPQLEDAAVPVTLTAVNASGTVTSTVDLTVLGTASPLPPLPPLVISEFFWTYNGTIPVEPYQFFEIHNRGASAVNLDGIQLFGSIYVDLSQADPRELGADDFGLIVSNRGQFANTWPGERPIIASFDELLPYEAYAISSELALLDRFGREIEKLTFPSPHPSQDFLEPAYRIDEGAPPTFPDNWDVLKPDNFDGSGSGTPGEAHFDILSFTATPLDAAPGDTVTLSWEVSRDVPLHLSQGIGPVAGPLGGTSFVIPADATELSIVLTAETQFDTFTRTLRLVLPPSIRNFSLSPRSITRGESVTLRYTVSGDFFNQIRVDPEVGRTSSPVGFRPLFGGFRERGLWRYLPNGNGQGPEWRDVDFDDRSWNYGRGIFGYGNDIEETVLEPGDYITAYFRREFQVDEVDQIESLSVDLLIDDGAEIYLNGTEILRELLPEGEIDFNTQPTGISPNDGRIYRNFPIDVAALAEGNNVIAVGAHNNVRFAEDFGFDLGLESVKQVPPDGRKTYTLTAANQSGTAAAQVTILIDVDSTNLADWQTDYGLDGDASSKDSDADNITDLVEFATGSDPTLASPQPLTVALDADGKLTVRYSHDLSAAGVALHAEISTDLMTWLPLEDEFVFEGSIAEEGSTAATTAYRSYAPAAGQRYVRLVAMLLP